MNGRDLIAAFREHHGPSEAAVDRIADRLQALGPVGAPKVVALPSRPRRRPIIPVGVAVIAVAAALVLGWWIRGETFTPTDDAAPSLAEDHADTTDQPQTAHPRTPTPTHDPTGPHNAAPTPDPRDPASPMPPPDPASSASPTSLRNPGDPASPPPDPANRASPTPPRDPANPASPSSSRNPGGPASPTPQPDTRDPASPASPTSSHNPGAPASAEPPPHRRDPTSSRSPPPRPSMAEEIRLIQRARAQLSRNQPKAALSTLAAYRKRFAAGTLREEADAVRTMARCRLGEGRAAAFTRTYPRSLFRQQVEQACKKD